jgi:SAM-dependent methyltransferase
MEDWLKANRDKWNSVVDVHARAPSYNLDGFRRGDNVLFSLELGEVGDVRGKSLLHLQCHFGLDTMSWARLGATVTGLDISDRAIDLARKLSAELSIPAKFVLGNIYDAPSLIDGRFDVVFQSYGAICWLPDMRRWAEVIAHFVKPGGFFYIADLHPFASIFAAGSEVSELRMDASYFRQDAIIDEPGPDYADPNHFVEHRPYEWIHSVASIVNSLIDAGLTIEFFHEHRDCVWKIFPYAKQRAGGTWHVEGDPIPLIFSLRARKPTSDRR